MKKNTKKPEPQPQSKPVFDGPIVAEVGPDGQRRFTGEQIQNVFRRCAVINFALAGQKAQRTQAKARTESKKKRKERVDDLVDRVIKAAKELIKHRRWVEHGKPYTQRGLAKKLTEQFPIDDERIRKILRDAGLLRRNG